MADNTYDPGLADGWERFDDSGSPESNDWDDDTATEQENIPANDEN